MTWLPDKTWQERRAEICREYGREWRDVERMLLDGHVAVRAVRTKPEPVPRFLRVDVELHEPLTSEHRDEALAVCDYRMRLWIPTRWNFGIYVDELPGGRPLDSFRPITGTIPHPRPTVREIAEVEDPLERLRMRYGEHPTDSYKAMVDAHQAIESAWFQQDDDARVGILEIWFRPGTSPSERSAAARAAYDALRAWCPNLDDYDVRARPGREHPVPPKYLGPRRTELEWLALERAKRLRLRGSG